MGYENALKYVIPHFDKYPLISFKQIDYLLWKQIIFIQKSQQHFTTEGFLHCLSLKAHLNKGLNSKLKSLFPNLLPLIKPQRILPNIIDNHWLSGFTAGDGSFMVIIKKNPTCKTGYQVQAVFNIGQHIKDIELMNKIKDLLNCGNVYSSKNDCRIVVNKFYDIKNIIIPQFKTYPLMNIKKQSFYIWCDIIYLISNKLHLTPQGFNQIRLMR
jgi:hypothetical protein